MIFCLYVFLRIPDFLENMKTTINNPSYDYRKQLVNNHNYHLSNFLGSLKVAQQQKKSSFKYWPATKLIISVTQVLREEGFISGFSVAPEQKNSRRIEVFLKYYSQTAAPLVTTLQTYASPSRAYNITYKRLVKLTRGKPANLYILSTNRGILTSERCLSLAIGGKLLLKVR